MSVTPSWSPSIGPRTVMAGMALDRMPSKKLERHGLELIPELAAGQVPGAFQPVPLGAGDLLEHGLVVRRQRGQIERAVGDERRAADLAELAASRVLQVGVVVADQPARRGWARKKLLFAFGQHVRMCICELRRE